MCETISTWNVTIFDESNLDCEDFCVKLLIIYIEIYNKSIKYNVCCTQGTRMQIGKSLCGGTMVAV